MFIFKSCKAVLNAIRLTSSASLIVRRGFTDNNVKAAAQLPPRMVIKEEDIEEAFLKGSGPGGQKIVCQPFRAYAYFPDCNN